MCRVGNPKYVLICCMRINLNPPFWITIHYHSTPKLVKKHHSEVFSSYYTYIIYGATTPVAITLTDLPFSPLHPCFPSQHSITMAFSIWAKRSNGHESWASMRSLVGCRNGMSPFDKCPHGNSWHCISIHRKNQKRNPKDPWDGNIYPHLLHLPMNYVASFSLI